MYHCIELTILTFQHPIVILYRYDSDIDREAMHRTGRKVQLEVIGRDVKNHE